MKQIVIYILSCNRTKWITGKSMCLSIYLSKSEQEVFDI